jgi:hypothetical protein
VCQQARSGLCLQLMPRHVSYRIAALSLLLLAGGAIAQTITTYRWVDAQGVVHYSDTPQPGAQVIQLQSAQTYRAPAPSAAAIKAARADAASGNDAASPYQSCNVGEPAPEASFFAPETIPITVALSPGLRGGDQVSVTVDGVPVAPASPGGLQFQLPAPERGAHSVSALVSDGDGKTVCHSAPLTFYVQRPSVNSPAAPVRPH